MKKEITSRQDIRKLVTLFHERLMTNDEFKIIFLDVAQLDMLEHMDIIIDFWESVLFQAGIYKNDLIDKHLELNRKFNYGLNAQHFTDWLIMFNAVLDENFEGVKAEEARAKARSLASIIKAKIDFLENKRFEINN